MRLRNLNLLVLCLLPLLFSACAYYGLIDENQVVEVGKTFQVRSPIAWSKHSEGATETWTVDGPLLQRLVFFYGIEDGVPLVKTSSQPDDMPLFHKDMAPLEIKELWEATMSRSGAYQIVVESMKPIQLDRLDCFQFEFRFTTKSGLDYQGFMIAGIREEKLIGIIYEGTSLYHYRKHLKDVKAILASVRLL